MMTIMLPFLFTRDIFPYCRKTIRGLGQTEERPLLGVEEIPLAFTGSAGMGIADGCSFPFYQEVYAIRETTKRFYPEIDSIIELGGEDAKILFLNNGVEVRMNGTCAGGTGAFIDQMANLLNVRTEDVNELAKKHERTYTIASRCGVFAKSDIQPLLNQGARKEVVHPSHWTKEQCQGCRTVQISIFLIILVFLFVS